MDSWSRYMRALLFELWKMGLKVQRQVPINVYYEV